MAGQRHVVSTLQQAVAQDKLAHAYLFAGTRGTGKTSAARILAKVLLTRGMEDGTLKQQIIEGVEEGNLVDLVEIDAASNRGIDDIRGLVEKIQFSPIVAKAKVYIIDEVHMLTREAFNALLKTLEEPPPYAYFILATTELHKIPATIQSRCQRYVFRQIQEEDIVARLRYVADTEKMEVEDEALRVIAHHVQGGLRDALSLLDQLRSLPKVTAEDVRSRVGDSGHQYVETVMDALRGGDKASLLASVRNMEEAGIPLDHFVRLLLAQARKELHAAVDAKQPAHALERMIAVLLDAVKDVRLAPVPGLVVESALLALCGPSSDETGFRPAPSVPPASPPPAPRPTPPAAPSAPAASTPPPVAPAAVTTPIPPVQAPRPAAVVATPEPSAAPGAIDLFALKNAWPDIIKATEPASARVALKSGMIHSIDGETVVLSFTSAFNKEKVSTPEATRSVEAAFEKILKHPLKLKALTEGEAGPPTIPASSFSPSPSPKQTPPPDDAVDLASAAADIF